MRGNPNRKLYRSLPISKEEAEHLLAFFPYFEEFLDVWSQRYYPVSKCTREQVACIPVFTEEQEKFLDALIRPFETDPIRSWYAKEENK